MNDIVKNLSRYDVELAKVETTRYRVKCRFYTVIFLSVAIVFQLLIMAYGLEYRPQHIHHLSGIIMLSLPATIGAIGSYIGISAYRKTD